MPHHYDHHMGSNQDANWCVSYPWFDWILGTRLRSVPATEQAPAKMPAEALGSGSVGSVLAAVGDDRGFGALRNVRRV
jgi:hypothetical protein